MIANARVACSDSGTGTRGDEAAPQIPDAKTIAMRTRCTLLIVGSRKPNASHAWPVAASPDAAAPVPGRRFAVCDSVCRDP